MCKEFSTWGGEGEVETDAPSCYGALHYSHEEEEYSYSENESPAPVLRPSCVVRRGHLDGGVPQCSSLEERSKEERLGPRWYMHESVSVGDALGG